MSDELVEAVAATIACNSPSGLQYPWHRAAALAIVAEVIERCAKAIDETEIYGAGPGWTERELYRMSIRKLGEGE